MKRIAMFTGLALALAAPAFAQETDETTPPVTTPTPVTPETPATPETPITTETPTTTPTPMTPETPETPVTPEPDPATATTTTTTATDDTKSAGSVTSSGRAEYRGPGRKHPGRVEGDPPIIDHSADTLVVEPPTSTITIPAQP